MLNIQTKILHLNPSSVIISLRNGSNLANHENLILLSTTNNVTRMTFNNPKKLNGWDSAMIAR